MTRDIDIFFYGLFMDTDALRASGLQPRNVRRAFVRDFSLHIGARATLVPVSGTEVHGFVIGLSHAEIESLYADASVRAYRPEAVLAKLEDGNVCAALCFNLEAPPGPAETNPDYAQKLRDLGRRLRLPDDYVDKIR